MNDFIKRIITGFIFLFIMIGSIVWNQWSFFCLFGIILLLALWEFYNIVESDVVKPQKISGVCVGLLMYIVTFIAVINKLPMLLLFNIPLFFLLFIAELFKNQTSSTANIAYTLLGLVYIAIPLSLLNYVAFAPEMLEYNYFILLGYLSLIWVNDTAAYISGKVIGKHKLFERISPQKTWEGAIGGFVFSIIACYFLSIYFKVLSLPAWFIMGLIVVVTGTIGDLVESHLKRNFNQKNSGKLLPGHGGILDRFDSLLFSVPFVVLFLYLTLFLQ